MPSTHSRFTSTRAEVLKVLWTSLADEGALANAKPSATPRLRNLLGLMPGTIDEVELEDFLESLPAAIYRVKGVLLTDAE